MFKKRKYLAGLIALLATAALFTQITVGQENKSGWDYLQNSSSGGEVIQEISSQTKNVSKRIYKDGDLQEGVLSIRGAFESFPKEKTISLNLRNANVKEVLRELAREGGKNIIIDSSVSPKKEISCELEDVSINQAMELVLSTAELESRIVDQTIFIASKSGMLRKGLNRRVVKSFPLNYANAVDVASVLNSSIFNTGLEVTTAVKESTEEVEGTEFQATEVPESLEDMSRAVAQGEYSEAGTQATSEATPGIATEGGATGAIKTAAVRKVRIIEEEVDAPKNVSDANKGAGTIKVKGTKFKTSTFDVPNNSGGPIVVPDTRTNSVLVAGIEEDIFTAERTIRHLDRPLKQVSIEVSLVEITKADAEELGLTIASGAKGFTGGFNNPLDASGNFNQAPVFNPNMWSNQQYVNSQGGTTVPTSAFGAPQSVGLATQVGEMALQMSTIKNITSNIAVKLNALMTKRKAKLIANPNVIAIDGAESLIKLTDQVVNRVTTSTTSTGVTNTNIELFDAGIVLHVRPKVSKDGYVSLTVRPSVTSPSASQTIGTIEIQLISTREVIIENVRVKSGETIALAGLVRERSISETSKVPFIADIPLIGNFFKNVNGTKEKTELVILLTPKIIDDIATSVNPIINQTTTPID